MGGFFELRRRVTPYRFPKPLEEGVIVARPNRFLMDVVCGDGETRRFHCPTTGKIGNIKLEGRPVLFKWSTNPKNRCAGTIQAISYDKPSKKEKDWIGINQNEANRYVEHFLNCGGFQDMLRWGKVHREQKLGNSRIDFKVGDTYLEVKTPVQVIEKVVPSYIETWQRKKGQLSGGERLVKHMTELGNALKDHERCIMLSCFLYPEDPDATDRYDDGGTGIYGDVDVILKALTEAEKRGLECWKAHFRLDKEKVVLLDYRKDQ